MLSFQLKRTAYCCCPRHGLWLPAGEREQVLRLFEPQLRRQDRWLELVIALRRGDEAGFRLVATRIMELEDMIRAMSNL